MQVEDIAGVAALAAGEPTAPHWPVSEYRRMLQVIEESPHRRGAWVLLLAHAEPDRAEPARAEAANEPSQPQLPKVPPQVAGFAMASQVAEVCDLEAVVVAAEWRGRQFGAALVEAAAAWGRSLGASRLELEVRVSNHAALQLYRRMGFTVDGRRPGYYRNPEEDAVLMSLALGS